MRRLAILAAIAGLSACATPGIDYEARLVPANTAAVETRLVDVGRFNGPGGNWYASEFEAMLARAAEEGAKRALADVGLDGEEAALDIRDLRSMLDLLRLVRRTAVQTVVRAVTTAILLALLAGVAIKLKIFGSGP